MTSFLKAPRPKQQTVSFFRRAWLKPGDAEHEDGEDLMPESRFRKALYLERCRAERSRKLFLLVLLRSTQHNGQSASGAFIQGVKKVFSNLASSIRETDRWGWYEDNATAGIIFTEFNGTEKPVILATVSEKLDQALRAVLPYEHMQQLRLSFHFFPEDWTDKDRPQPPEMFYPNEDELEKSAQLPRAIKRFIDIAGSLTMLTLLSPLFAAIALAIKLDSRGPVIFKQERVGQFGRLFLCLKFRSMAVENNPDVHKEYIRRFIAGEAGTEHSDEKGKRVFKIARDKRVTRIGSWLRKTSIDELPQLLNVLKGEMSLVGPRPPVPYELQSYHVWHVRRIFEAKPGITGLWQVMGRSRTTFDEMVRLDLRYARTWSLWLDLKILARTPHAVFSGNGAY
jgi:lipopolysaccharide/colanic/teichoic acid biosynthesis glycosyltransferase